MIRRLHAPRGLFLALSVALITLAALSGAHAADPEAPMLTPGPGWTGPTPQPDPIGTGFGADAKAIARWDVVPYQTIDCCFEVGVVAFHINGIDRVEFSAENGPWVAVREMTLNPRTQVVEYWAVVDGNAFPDGPIEIRAIAYPKVGIPRVLAGDNLASENGEHSLRLTVARDWSPQKSVISETGEIFTALSAAPDGATIEIAKAGTYYWTGDLNYSRSKSTKWLTLKLGPGLALGDVIIKLPDDSSSQLLRAGKLMKYEGIAFDFKKQQYYNGGREAWFSKCLFFDSLGKTNSAGKLPPVRHDGLAFATDCELVDSVYGFVNFRLVRNCLVDNISGDAFQNSLCVLRSRGINFDGSALEHHSDVLQYYDSRSSWGCPTNVIVYGLNMDLKDDVQAMFFYGYKTGPFRDYAVVDTVFSHVWTDPVRSDNGGHPFTQFYRECRNMLFKNVMISGQQIIFRTDVSTPDEIFRGHSVVFDGCRLHSKTWRNFIEGSPPEGVEFKNCTK